MNGMLTAYTLTTIETLWDDYVYMSMLSLYSVYWLYDYQY